MRIAILDLYEGQPNQGMRCIREIISGWKAPAGDKTILDEYEVRLEQQVPGMDYDVYISSGGPGSPLDSEGSAWERKYLDWLETVMEWNRSGVHEKKKHVFFICHSFQLACRHLGVGNVTRRKSTAFGVFPVHITPAGQSDRLFSGLQDPFYVVDSRDFQVVDPHFENIGKMGASILCIEKYRPHVPYQQAVMGIRFNPWMTGTQFHPEADAQGMSMYLQTEEKKKIVIETHGEEKWKSMVDQLSDPDKIMATYSSVLPNFLHSAGEHIYGKD